MAQQFFEELHDKKQKIKSLITKAEELGWIETKDKDEYLSKLDKDELTIGVIGQMKSGKSTFLNAFLFEDDVLPAAVTPMTAALSVITYGPEKKLVAEFYSEDEWQEQLATAKMSIEDTSDLLLKSKIKAAQELVEKSSKLGSSLNSFLGKTQEDSFDKLEEYVGAEGKYVSITKSVTIYYPKEYLKGVKIVDTPGFNDPIVSREQRTQKFLKDADVVLLMLYAGRPFDATDSEILFKHVGDCGIGKVLIAVNKYDIPYARGNKEAQICNYIKEQIESTSKEMGDERLNDILRDTQPLPLSAEMALLSFLPMSKITANNSYSHAWGLACKTFDISTHEEMHAKSYIDVLINAMRQVIEREKETILFKKPLNAILKKGEILTADINNAISATKAEIAMLEMPDDELDEMESSLSRVERRIDKKINSLGDDLHYTFKEIIRRGSNMLEDAVDNSCKKMNNIVDNWKWHESVDKLKINLEREMNFLVTRTLKRTCDEIDRDALMRIKSTLNEFFNEAEDILLKLPNEIDFDQQRFVKDISRQIDLTINDKSLFQMDDDEEEEYGIGDAIYDFFNGATYGLLGLVTRLLSHSEIVKETKKFISDMQRDFDAQVYLEKIISNKDKIIDEVKERFDDGLLTPFRQKLDEIRQQGLNKQQKLEDAKRKLSELNAKKEEIDKQVKIINDMK